ncbi:Major facilitator, sugar transporter-like [Dillenia turbinata]|uniref:Major facilitator, sugar transporter-like n=1 Tax=Dillenia turbinata TaxID=194707 RepID=A0AAN8YZS4_9MAGN
MKRESEVDGGLSRSLLEQQSDDGSEGGGDNGEEVVGESSSAVTVVLLFTTLVAVCGTFGSGCALGYSSQAESGIMEDLGLSLAEYSVFGSMSAAGGTLGALVCGKITDLIGRRGALWLSEVFCFAGWLAIAFSKGAWSLDLGRLSVGTGVAVLTYVAPVYVAEISPKNLRGGLTVFNQFVLCLGMSTIYFVGNIISWRVLALIGALPALLQLIGLFFIPESPRWLAKNGQEKGCESVLRRLRGRNADIDQEAAEIRDYIESLKLQPQNKFWEMFQRKYAYALTVGVGLMALQQTSGATGIACYASSVFEMAGFSSSVGTASMAAIQIPSTALGVFLMDRWGRRPLLIVSAAGMCFACFLAGMSILFQDFQWLSDVTPALVYIALLVMHYD